MNKIFKIALDFDDVIYSTNAMIIDTFTEHGLGREEALSFMRQWGLVGAPQEIIKAVKDKFGDPAFSCDQKRIMKESKDWIEKHKDIIDFIVVTARPESIAAETKAFIAEHVGIKNVFVEPKSKTNTLIQQKVDFIIDDGCHNLQPFFEPKSNITPILVSTPLTVYNHSSAEILGKRNLVVSRLADISVEYLKEVKVRRAKSRITSIEKGNNYAF